MDGIKEGIKVEPGIPTLEGAMTFGNLHTALKQCCRNVRWKDSVVGYEWNGLKNTHRLLQESRSGKYRLGKYQVFMITEPKERRIVATSIKDRQFQRVLCDHVVYPELTRGFIAENCACQNGRGVDYCLRTLKAQLREYYGLHGTEGWVLKCDIRKYFDSTPHATAKAAIAARIRDSAAARECFRIIDSFDGDAGIGLGSQNSQLTQLAVLDDLDHMVKERLGIRYYVRYMDDFLLIDHEKDKLSKCLEAIRRHLEGLGLDLNRKTCIYPLGQGVKILQWRLRVTRTGRVVMLMDQRKMSAERRKLRKLYEMENAGKLRKGTAHDSLQSWLANARRGDTFECRKRMLSFYYCLTAGKEEFNYGQRKHRKKAVKSRSYTGTVQVGTLGCIENRARKSSRIRRHRNGRHAGQEDQERAAVRNRP